MKKQNGITLIALVITIVVLLILAGVSISMVLGDNGILTKAKTAASSTNEATIKEYISNALVSTEAEFLVNGGAAEAKTWYEVKAEGSTDADAGKGSDYFDSEVKKSGLTSGKISTYAVDETSKAITYTGEVVVESTTTYTWTATNGKITIAVKTAE